MILNIRHKGLARFFRTGDTRGIGERNAARLRILLTALETAAAPDEIGRLPGTRLHQLKGDRRGNWAVWVSGNWQLAPGVPL